MITPTISSVRGASSQRRVRRRAAGDQRAGLDSPWR
jgi:hypothetical protein